MAHRFCSAADSRVPMVAYGAIRTPGHAASAPVSTSRRTYSLLACGLALAGVAAVATQQRSSGVQDNYGENTASTASNWRDAAWVTATVKQQAGNTTVHPCASPDICDPKQCRSDKDARKPVCKKCLECHNAHNKGNDAKCTPHCWANGKNNEAFCENTTASHFKNKAACEGSGGKCHFNDCGGSGGQR